MISIFRRTFSLIAYCLFASWVVRQGKASSASQAGLGRRARWSGAASSIARGEAALLLPSSDTMMGTATPEFARAASALHTFDADGFAKREPRPARQTGVTGAGLRAGLLVVSAIGFSTSLLLIALLRLTVAGPGASLVSYVHDRATPETSINSARLLLVIACTMGIVTAATALAAREPETKRRRMGQRSTVASASVPPPQLHQRHRGLIVLLSGIPPIALAAAFPLIASAVGSSSSSDIVSGVGQHFIDLAAGAGLPAVILGVFYFRTLARVVGIASDASDGRNAPRGARRA